MGTTVTEDKIYYIQAIGEASTRVGGYMIQPNMPPKELTEEQYRNNKRIIDFYEKQGVISVAEPGTPAAIFKADAIERERERMEEIFAGEDGEIDGVMIKRGFAEPEEKIRERMQTSKRTATDFSAPSEKTVATETEYKCIALAKSEKRCKNVALGDLLVCGIHQRMLKNDTTLKNARGHIISKDGKSLEGLTTDADE